MENLESALQGIAYAFIQRVMERVPEEDEELFLQWADSFAKLEPQSVKCWEKLRTKINWPI